MKRKLIIWLTLGLLVLSSCKKDNIIPEPFIEIKLGHLIDTPFIITMEEFENQDTLFLNPNDTVLTIRVSERNLVGFSSELDRLELEDIQSFDVYINTRFDAEWYFKSEGNKYSFSGGMGHNNLNQLEYFDHVFKIPINSSTPIISDRVVQFTRPDFLRVSYESSYTGLSKVKTFIIK